MTSILLMVAAVLNAQPADADLLRLIDTYELVPGGQQPSAAAMYSGEGAVKLEGSFLVPGRNEFLATVPLVRGEKETSFSFVCYQDENGEWQRSNWFSLAEGRTDRTDADGSGCDELIMQAEYIGRRMTKRAWRLVSLAGDSEQELFKSEGFDLSPNARLNSAPGEVVSESITIEMTDLDKDGRMEIVERIRKELRIVATQEEVGNQFSETTHYYRLEDGAYKRYVPKDKELPH